MTLRKRINGLETRRMVNERDTGARGRLAAKLAHIELVVVASGDASDRPGASLIERTVRRYLRGDADMGDALRDLMGGRWP